MNFTTSTDAIATAMQCEAVFDESPFSAGQCQNVTTAAYQSLNEPIDFPELKSAIVPGDHVVLAVDPNVSQIAEVIAGVIKAIGETDADKVDVVVWDEASETVLKLITDEVSPSSRVVQHQGSNRRDLRYLAADPAADPVYLNRLLVDADFVLPIVAARVGQRQGTTDLSGIYPALVDSASRLRQQAHASSSSTPDPNLQTAWLLGVQMMLCVFADREGQVAEVCAGTVEAIDQRIGSLACLIDDDHRFDLVVAVINGPDHIQNWANAARAATAAAKHADDDATIVVWTEINQPLDHAYIQSPQDFDRDDEEEMLVVPDSADENGSAVDEDFPAWNPASGPARKLASIAEEHRLLIRSGLDEETIEAMGFGVIENSDQIRRLSEGFDAGLLLRAAQFRE